MTLYHIAAHPASVPASADGDRENAFGNFLNDIIPQNTKEVDVLQQSTSFDNGAADRT